MDATDEGAVVEIVETVEMLEAVPAEVQRDDCSPSIQVGLPVGCHQEISVLNSIDAAAACRAAAGDMSMCVIESQPQVESNDLAGSDKADVGSTDHDRSAKVVDTFAGNVDFEEAIYGPDGHVDSVKADNGSLVYADDSAKVGDVHRVDVVTPTEDHLRYRLRVELSLSAERSTVNPDSAAVFSGSGPIEGHGDAGDGLQGSNVQKTVKWAAELTDSVPVSWLRLRAELEQLEQDELDEEDSVPSLFLLGCFLLVKRRSLHKKRSRTSGRWPNEEQDHMRQEAHSSDSTDAGILEGKTRRFAAFHMFNWTKSTN